MAQMTKTQRPSHAGFSFHRDTLTSWNEIGADKGKHYGWQHLVTWVAASGQSRQDDRWASV